MSYRRRPRTKVYDCNFNIGESYYRPVMESLDRKHSGRVDPVTPLGEREGTPSGRFSKLLGERDHEGTPSSRASKLYSELETNGVDLSKTRARTLVDDDDAAIDAEFEDTLKRIKAARAQRNADLEEEFNSFASKKKIDISDHLLDSVGLNNKTQRAIEDDVLYKRKGAARKRYEEEDDGVVTKWTAVRPGARALQEAEEVANEGGAMARARKSKARIQDIDAELEELAAKGAARQKRIQDLRSLMSEDDSSSTSATSSLKVSKRISVKSSSEKHVSF